MSLISKHSHEHNIIQDLHTQIYHPHPTSNCNIHHLPRQYTCIKPTCQYYCVPICKECHFNHPLLSINKIVPKLTQWAQQEWETIQAQNRLVESEWRVCLVNVDYCLDIMKQLKKQIQERSTNMELTVFKELVGEVHGMFTHNSSNVSVEMLLKNYKKINDKFQLISGQEQTVSCMSSELERTMRKNQVKQASEKTKLFSQKALAFSQNLAKLIEEKLKGEKRLSKLKQLSNNRIFTLKDLLKQQSKLQEVGQLMIEIPKIKEEQTVIGLLDKCQNLKLLRINNKNGGIQKNNWKKITQGMDYLKLLKELVLNIRACDLKILIPLFKEKSKAVRQIQKLNLQITDQKELDVSDVYNFINTMELRSLSVTLARDNLKKNQVIQFLQKLRITTSLTQLPLNELNLNFNKNKITQGIDAIEITHLFNAKTNNIKSKIIVL